MMTQIIQVLVVLLIIIGAFFALSGVIGIIRMPDSFCRMQASTIIPTMGTICVLIGVSLYGFFILNSIAIGIKPLIIIVFILFSNPAASYAIARAAKRCKVNMTNKSDTDDYGRDNPQ